MHQKNSIKPALIRMGIAVLILALSAGFLYFWQRRPDVRAQLYDITVMPPTCTDSGYSLYTSKENGATFVDDVLPALGHSFGQWEVLQERTGLSPEISLRTCSVCGAREEQVQYPQTSIPLLALEGDVSQMGKKKEVPITAELIGAEQEFSHFATLKYQGHESLRFEKKNYTLKLYQDEARREKNKMTFSHWNPEHKYILKANYVDPSQCRNLICADIWADITASRDRLPAEFKDLPNYGAVDGFPVALYLNREFQGLYTFNLHKDDDLFGMEEGKDQAILIANHASAPEALFRESAAFAEDSPWEVEFCGTEDRSWAQNKLNDLISFVTDSDDQTFREKLHIHLDVDSAIDYLLAFYALGLTSCDKTNLTLVCYHASQPFTASHYDMDSAFGLSDDGTSAAGAELHLPVLKDGRWDSATGNLLWDRLLQNFQPRIASRYQKLRESLLNPENLCRRVLDYTAAIPADLVEGDNVVFPHPNPSLSQTDQITNYITRRIPLLDNLFLNGEN